MQNFAPDGGREAERELGPIFEFSVEALRQQSGRELKELETADLLR